MFRKLFWLAVIVGAFYLHSRYIFSEVSSMNWLAKQESAAMRGEPGICEHLDDDFKAHVVYSLPGGRAVEQEHAKKQYCESLKDMAAALRVSKGRVSTNRDVQSISISSFPWLRAEVVVDEETSVMMGGSMRSASMKTSGVATYSFSRRLDGLKLDAVSFEGEMTGLR